MADYSEAIQESVRSQLMTDPVLLQNPRGVSLTDVYASPGNSTLSLAKMHVATGRARITPNNLNFSGTSSFYVSSSSLVNGWVLSAKMTLSDATNMINPGWLFQCIRELQITFNNSQLQNMTITGKSLYDYALVSAKDKDARRAILENAGEFGSAAAGAVQVSGSIPLAFLIQSCAGVSGFPLDMAVIGNLTINVVWNPSTYFITGVTNSAVASPPTGFDEVVLSYSSIDLVDKTYAVSSVMQQDPELSYVVPVKYISTSVYEAPNYTRGSEIIFQINSFPTGNCVAMLLNFYPLSWQSDALLNKYMNSVDFTNVRLEFAGSVIFEADSLQEFRLHNLLKFGDDLSYPIVYTAGGLAAGSSPGQGDNGVRHVRSRECNTFCIPLGDHMDKILRGNHGEVLTQYAGSTLQLRLTTKTAYYEQVYKNLDSDSGGGDATRYYPQQQSQNILTSTNYQLNITFINEALLTTNRGVVKMVL